MAGDAPTTTPDEFAALLSALRGEGWTVAVHNDYRLGGEFRTFWLLTHSNGRWIKGEGRTDLSALQEAYFGEGRIRTVGEQAAREVYAHG